MKAATLTARKIACATTLGLTFLFLASVFVPDFSHALPDDRGAAGSAGTQEGLTSLGTIEDDQYFVRVVATANGPLYSVYDRSDGRELAALLTAEQAAEWFPNLPIPAMEYGTDESPLMMAEPAFLDFH